MGAKSSKADPAPEPEEPPTKKQKTETPMSPTTPKPKPKKLKTFLEAMKKSEMQALADALEVTYAKGDKAEDLAAKIAKGLNRPSGFKATRTQAAPLTVRVVWCAAGILKSMLAANELKIGGSKEALVDRIIEAI